jgi:hypothetical protein
MKRTEPFDFYQLTATERAGCLKTMAPAPFSPAHDGHRDERKGLLKYIVDLKRVPG